MPVHISQEMLDRFKEHGFSVSFPYNHDPLLWESIAPYAEVIDEIYTGLHPDVFPSLRSWPENKGAGEHLDSLAALMGLVSGKGVALNLIMNAHPTELVDEGPLFAVIDRLGGLGEIRVTVNDIIWARRLRDVYPDLSMEVSTAAGIVNQHTALQWDEIVGVQTFVIGLDINKDERRIRDIRELGKRIKMVVSDYCLANCPARFRHQILLASKSSGETRAESIVRHQHFCRYMKRKLPVWHWVKKEVLPFQLPRYRGLVDIIKLCDRENSTPDNMEILARYLAMEEDVHPLLGYREPVESFDRLRECRRNCATCEWCAENVEIIEPRRDVDGDVGDYRDAYRNICLNLRTDRGFDQTEEDERGAEKGPGAPDEPASEGEGERETPIANGRAASEAAAPPVGLESLKQVKSELEASHDVGLLRLMALTTRKFRNQIIEGKPLGSGFRFHRVFLPYPDALGIEWRRGDGSFSIAVLSPAHKGAVAFRGKEAAIAFIEDARRPESERLFREVERQLRGMVE